MTSIAERLLIQARARLKGLVLRPRQHMCDVLIEVEADDLAALVNATPDNLDGVAKQAREVYAISSAASAGRIVAVRADHLEALAAIAVGSHAAPSTASDAEN